MDASTLVYLLFTTLLIPLVGVMVAITPWLMRNDECFAVTIPASAQKDPEIRGFKRSYTAWTLAVTLVLAVVSALVFVLVSPAVAVACLVADTVVLMTFSFALMLHYRKMVQELKERKGWTAGADLRSAVVGEREVPRPLSPWWEVLNVPVIAVTLAIGIAGYAAMPDLVPIHMGLDGQVNDWAEKSPLVILFAPLFQLFLTAVFAFTQWGIARSKKPNAPGAPVSSAYAYGRFARAQGIFMLVMGLILNVSAVAIQLSMVGAMELGAAALVMAGAAVVAVVGAIVLAVVYGQSGARAMAQPVGEGGLLHDDDRFWKLGVFYVNAHDPSLFVPKRFGVGWTVNFGRPSAWALMVGLVLAVVAFVLIIGGLL